MINNNFYNIKIGSTRTVFINKKYAYKLCFSFEKNSIHSIWRKLLNGLVCNLQESSQYKQHKKTKLFCPVYCSILGGIIIKMPRVDELDPNANLDEFQEKMNRCNFYLKDFKIENLGMLNGEIVIIDYADYSF